MTNNHLTYFKVESFKKFESLEVTDIGQFNLIVGDNNVGKTCFLEALLFDEDPKQLLNNFYLGLTKRGLTFQIEEITIKRGNKSETEVEIPKINYFSTHIIRNNKDKLLLNYSCGNKKFQTSIKLANTENIRSYFMENTLDKAVHTKENTKSVLGGYDVQSIKINDYINQFIEISNNDGNHILWIYNYDLKILNFPLISFNDTPLDEESRSIYENLKTKREKQILIDVLKVVNPNIVDIELRENFEDLKSVFLISFEDKDEFVPLNFLGDGFKRIFYIVLKALSLKGKRILIDEFEIGIHYSKMKNFWINIMNVCKELDVQLFATTHSDECTQAFVSASSFLKNTDDIRLIKLEESTNKEKIYASTFSYNKIVAGLESNVELRG